VLTGEEPTIEDIETLGTSVVIEISEIEREEILSHLS
jgi:hypothetical protein